MNVFEVCFLTVSHVLCIQLVHISSLDSQAFVLQSLTSVLISYAIEPLMCKEVRQQK